jgi:acetyl-CoA C-acetyltransferase
MTTSRIVGWSHSAFGKRDEQDTEQLMAPVVDGALTHAGVDAADVDGIFVGVLNHGFSRQDFQASLVGVCDQRLARTPATRVENACATGSAALYAALDFLDAGRGDVALVVGAEKMTGIPTSDVGDVLLCASYRAEEDREPGGFAGVFAGIAAEYFARYGDRSAELASIAAKNHRNAVDNPYAHMRKDLGFEFCNTVSGKNPYVAEPLRRTDCSLITDGAAALVVAREDVARDLARSVGFRGRHHANDHLPLSRRDATAFDGARSAWSGACDQAGIQTTDLDLIETHDCFTIAELIEYEAFGLAEPGHGHTVVRDGLTQPDGALPINRSGGLKAKGHPIGATGVSMHAVACMQLTGTAGDMQIPDAELVGVFNMGGAAVANYASILERIR